jgi:hypothetical protein
MTMVATTTSQDATTKAKAPDIGDDEPQMAAKDGADVTDTDVAHTEELRLAAEAQIARLSRKNEKFFDRLDRRHALRDGPAASEAADVRAQEAERLAAQEKAFAEAQERAHAWVEPMVVEGRMKDVKLLLHPEEKVRKMTIHLRALGEVPDGFIMVFEDPFDPTDLKQGRIAESERFGTKNRVRVKEFDDKGQPKGEITYPGYKDFGPLRMQAGKYRAVVVTTKDEVLAEESFTILPDWDEDGESDQVAGVRAPKYIDAPKETKSPKEESIEKAIKRGEKDGTAASVTMTEEQRAAAAAEQQARIAAKSAGEDVPPAPASETPKLSADEKKARKDSPEGRAQ